MSRNSNFSKAKKEKKDEFYTDINDIVSEIAQHQDYVNHFYGKTVLCNCDDPESSAFVEFFRKFYRKLKLKKMMATHYNPDGSPSYKLEWEGEKIHGDTVNLIKTPLEGNGDFRSEECIELLKEADIIVTNPPFSLFREYIQQLIDYNKKFIIWGNNNAITYKEVFPLLRDGKIWIGYMSNKSCHFRIPDSYEEYDEKYTKKRNDGYRYATVPAITVFTNLDIYKRHEPLMLTKNYHGNEACYPHYDNYVAIECNRVEYIPKDYFGAIGVPITYMSHHCPEQFEILDARKYGLNDKQRNKNTFLIKDADGAINGKPKYARILIKRKPGSKEM